jgi:hypothetical protein
VFTTTLTVGGVRENHVVEFEEGRRMAWMPAEVGQPRPGHLWRWELEPAGPSRTRVTCTYDWTRLTEEKRLIRARATTPEWLQERRRARRSPLYDPYLWMRAKLSEPAGL